MDNYKIYPKQFRTSKIPTERNTCFMVMPFKKEFDYIYGTIKTDLNEIGVICTRADEIGGSKPVLNKVLTEILKSQYIVVDLTGYNPNVFYELGVAHTFKDAQHILLIKQKESKIPFDLTHLTYIEYDADNLKYLTAIIRKFLLENKHIAEFHEALNINGIIDVIHANKEDFIDYVQTHLGGELPLVVDILNHSNEKLKESDIERVIGKYQAIIYSAIEENLFEMIPGILKLYYEIISSCSAYGITDVFVADFLSSYLDRYPLSIADKLSYRTDMALFLASRKKKLNMVIPWIIGYFSRAKTATIDLNRYKLEALLMTTQYAEINQAIINAVFDKNCYIREHVADIIGEKRLYDAKNHILKQLEIEENIFTAMSLIAAIGKLGDFEDIQNINNWIKKWEKNIIEKNQFFALKHCRIAISRLDTTKKQLNIFDGKFKRYLTEYFFEDI